jgi:predicted small secreted protein
MTATGLRISLIAGLLVVALGALSACNTMQGMGQDVQRAGEAVEDTATRAKSN